MAIGQGIIRRRTDYSDMDKGIIRTYRIPKRSDIESSLVPLGAGGGYPPKIYTIIPKSPAGGATALSPIESRGKKLAVKGQL